MNNVQFTEVSKLPRLEFSRPFFADYFTSLLSQIRCDKDCEALYTGKQKHPLIAVQADNTHQLQTLHIQFIPEAVLVFRPFAPTDNFIVDVTAKSNSDPLLDHGWDLFITNYEAYKDTQRKIFRIIVATLRVGTSVHYARAVPYGAGLPLLQTIREDNMQRTKNHPSIVRTICLTLYFEDEGWRIF